ncbi:MAG: hypothetical protein LC768_07435, partial [Acidobacteria bacterium]|nr:hypothetical protein [Acidobacteriota bacterium]
IILVLSLISLLVIGCDLVPQTQSNSPNPRVIPPEKVSRIAKNLPYAEFSYTGLAFFEGKLYASSVIGLLEFEKGKLSNLYQWTNEDYDVVEDLSFDKANHSLWMFRSKKRKLIRFDGKSWNFVDLPKVAGGYTRGDMLKSFNGFSTDSAFWLNVAGEAWRWNADSNTWTRQVGASEKDCYVTTDTNVDTRCFASIAPVQDRVLSIMHREYISGFGNPTVGKVKPPSDRVYYWENDKWQEVIPKDSVVDFVTKEVVVGKDAAFIKTWYGKLFRVTASEIVPIETLGEVEKMITTTSGNFL